MVPEPNEAARFVFEIAVLPEAGGGGAEVSCGNEEIDIEKVTGAGIGIDTGEQVGQTF